MRLLNALTVTALLALASPLVHADPYTDTVEIFKHAGESRPMFEHSDGYAVFPTIGKAGIGIGGAHGKGRVFQHGKLVGDVSMTQLSVGFQLGAQAYSEIIFFEDERAFRDFTAGNFEFDAKIGAVAITAAASASAGTTGASTAASTDKNDAAVAGRYYKGLAVYTVARGGLMYEASVAGQKFSYKKR
jgi:lipid-binding SYLF domain-containing protein